jgi:glycosyltransferase involved in cell wall biosynthesis
VTRLTVVVPTFQRCDLVLACVDALARQDTHAPYNVIVVVDDSSTDEPRLVDALHRWGEAQVTDHGDHAEHVDGH